MGKHNCSKFVYSGARWDFSGHRCGTPATVEEDGKWWCRRHAPSLAAAKMAAEREREREQTERRAAALAHVHDLLAALGSKGYPSHGSFVQGAAVHTTPVRGAFLPTADLERIVEALRGVR